jgi:hypothetical protein
MAVTGPQLEASRFAAPCRVADVTLAAAVHAQADAVYIEPLALAVDASAITLERASQVLPTVASLGLIGFTPALESV